jgi:spore coat polysaccharide biosynthesis protein SpsF
VFRGSEHDVLGRVVGAQSQQQSDIVVEITGDCILIDPQIVDLAVRTFFENDCDVVSTCRKRAFPMGMCAQVYTLSALRYVGEHVRDEAVREHVSLYFYEHPEHYRIVHVMAPDRWWLPECRTQLDYHEDLLFINAVYARLEPVYGEGFGIEELTQLMRREPDLLDINRHCIERSAR